MILAPGVMLCFPSSRYGT